MIEKKHRSTRGQGSGPIDRTLAINAPIGITVALFVIAALISGEATDTQLLPTVRFLSVVMLALAIYAAYITGTRCAYLKKNWKLGQVSAANTAFGSGFLWSGSGFGIGFLFLMIGALAGALLIAGILQKLSQRRQAAMKAGRVSIREDSSR